MGGGALEPKTVARVSKKAFTLAEVLITLAIIGVVAALTIPVVVQKYKQNMFYTKFMKTYNTLTNVLDLSQADNGSCDGWSRGEMKDVPTGDPMFPTKKRRDDSRQVFDTYLAPYLKISKSCQDPLECGIKNDLIINELNMDDSESQNYSDYISSTNSYSNVAYLISDGSLVLFYMSDNSLYGDITIDTNGAQGPNVRNIDIFTFEFTKKDSTKGGQCSFNLYEYPSKLVSEGKMNYWYPYQDNEE